MLISASNIFATNIDINCEPNIPNSKPYYKWNYSYKLRKIVAFIFWFNNSKVSNNCLAAFESNALVGSSTNINFGLVIIALLDSTL